MIGNYIGAPIGGVINAGGSLFSQDVSISGTGSIALTRGIGKIVSPTAAGAVILARAVAKALGVSASPTFSAGKAVTHQGPSISGVGTAAVSFTKALHLAITVLTSGAATISFHAGRVVMIHMTAMGKVSFGPTQISKAITTAATGAATLVKTVGKTIATGLTASITHAFAFFRFITKPNTIGKQITTTMARNATITSNPATETQITTSPESETDITTSRSLPRQITT